MPQSAIFGPFFATIALTIVVWVYMYVLRIRFINGSGLTPDRLAVPGELQRLQPASVSNPSDNFKNLFEVPVLFRVLHSAVHCTGNQVLLRFWLYAISTVAVFFIAVRAALAHFAS